MFTKHVLSSEVSLSLGAQPDLLFPALSKMKCSQPFQTQLKCQPLLENSRALPSLSEQTAMVFTRPPSQPACEAVVWSLSARHLEGRATVRIPGPPPSQGAWNKVVSGSRGAIMGLGSGVRLSWIKTPLYPYF